MADHDGHTINVGPVTVGVDPGRDRLWMLANWPKGNHLTIVLHDYCDEVDRLRAALTEARDAIRECLGCRFMHDQCDCGDTEACGVCHMVNRLALAAEAQP